MWEAVCVGDQVEEVRKCRRQGGWVTRCMRSGNMGSRAGGCG